MCHYYHWLCAHCNSNQECASRCQFARSPASNQQLCLKTPETQIQPLPADAPPMECASCNTTGGNKATIDLSSPEQPSRGVGRGFPAISRVMVDGGSQRQQSGLPMRPRMCGTPLIQNQMLCRSSAPAPGYGFHGRGPPFSPYMQSPQPQFASGLPSSVPVAPPFQQEAVFWPPPPGDVFWLPPWERLPPGFEETVRGYDQRRSGVFVEARRRREEVGENLGDAEKEGACIELQSAWERLRFEMEGKE